MVAWSYYLVYTWGHFREFIFRRYGGCFRPHSTFHVTIVRLCESYWNYRELCSRAWNHGGRPFKIKFTNFQNGCSFIRPLWTRASSASIFSIHVTIVLLVKKEHLKSYPQDLKSAKCETWKSPKYAYYILLLIGGGLNPLAVLFSVKYWVPLG